MSHGKAARARLARLFDWAADRLEGKENHEKPRYHRRRNKPWWATKNAEEYKYRSPGANHHSKEQSYWKVQNIFTGFTIFLAALVAHYAYLTFLATKGQVTTAQTLFPGKQDQVLTLFAADDAKNFLKLIKLGRHYAEPFIVGCITYLDSNAIVHQTGFIYDVYERANTSTGRGPIDLTKGVVPASQVVLTVDDLGDGPAD